MMDSTNECATRGKPFELDVDDSSRRLAESLSVRDLINQLLCPCFGHLPEDEVQSFGACFFSSAPAEKLGRDISRFREVCEIPPLITTDMECGPGNMIQGATKFPHMMGWGETNREELAYEAGRITAVEARRCGYNWTLAPCVDIAHDPDSPMVSFRSAGCDPERIIRICGAYLRGLQEHGMMATLKHFPGDGFSTLDQHLTTVDIPLSREDWHRTAGRIYRTLIHDGAMAVMPGHIAWPAYDVPDRRTGLYPPATLSPRLMKDLLRDELGFRGLIVSDAIGMGGAVGYMNYYDACATFWEAGGDCLLFSRTHERFYREMEIRLCDGRLREATLRERAARVISLKRKMGLFDAVSEPPPEIDKEAHEEVARQIVEDCVVIVRDRDEILPFPISAASRILHAQIVGHEGPMGEGALRLLAKLSDGLRERGAAVTDLIDPGPGRLFEEVEDGNHDLVIASIAARFDYGVNVVRLHGPKARNMMNGWMKLGVPVIFIAHHHPFFHVEYAAAADTVINCNNTIDITIPRLVAGLCGERPLKRALACLKD